MSVSKKLYKHNDGKLEGVRMALVAWRYNHMTTDAITAGAPVLTGVRVVCQGQIYPTDSNRLVTPSQWRICT